MFDMILMYFVSETRIKWKSRVFGMRPNQPEKIKTLHCMFHINQCVDGGECGDGARSRPTQYIRKLLKIGKLYG